MAVGTTISDKLERVSVEFVFRWSAMLWANSAAGVIGPEDIANSYRILIYTITQSDPQDMSIRVACI
jgi:hypothetical protein